MLHAVFALLGSYVVGSIPTAYLVVKRLKRVDVRTVGSGNVGATNVTRVAGLGAGAVVFLIDVAKGLVAVLLLARWLAQPAGSSAQLACGLMAVVGHSFPIFLKFRGGKGVATTIGVLLGAMPLVAGACIAVWAVSFLIWRYVSVASMAAAVTLPVAQQLTRQAPQDVLLGSALALLIVVRHRTNIQRLRQGSEHRSGHRRVNQ